MSRCVRDFTSFGDFLHDYCLWILSQQRKVQLKIFLEVALLWSHNQRGLYRFKIRGYIRLETRSYDAN